VKALKKICSAENIRCDADALMKIAGRTNDLRSAINDLQAAAMGREEVNARRRFHGRAGRPESIFKVMGLIFRGDDPGKARRAVMDLDESPEDLIGWVDENLPREYHDGDLERGFDALSKADLFLGRVRRRMDYGMWRYASFMMVAGVNRARKRRYGGYSKYSAPTYWQKLGRARGTRAVRDSLAGKIGAYCHTSRREARAIYIPLLRVLFKDEGYAAGITARLKLEEDEIAFLMDAEKSSRKVGKVYERSRDLIEEEAGHEIDVFRSFCPKEPAGHKAEEPADKNTVPEAPKPKRKRKTARDGGEVPAPMVVAEPIVEEPKKKKRLPSQKGRARYSTFDSCFFSAMPFSRIFLTASMST